MRIKRYETEVFAGITDCSVVFAEGMNVLVGANEAGKSTVLAGIYCMLFQPFNARKNSNIYTEFESLYKPANGGNYADGRLALEIGGREAVIEKSWFEEPSVRMRIGDVRMKSGEAEEKLSELLRYGQAFYSHIVFGRQSHERAVLEWLFDLSDAEGREDIRKRLSELSSVMSGIDLKLFQAMLDARLDELSGHWDMGRDAPELDNGRPRGIERPWKKGCGKILEAYYAWQYAKRDVEQVNLLNAELKQLEDKIEAEEKEKHSLQRDLDELKKSRSDMQNKALKRERLQELEKKLTEYKEDAARLPDIRLRLKEAEYLKSVREEQEHRQKKESINNRLAQIEALDGDIARLESETETFRDIARDAEEAERLEREAERLENQLSASRLSARITLADGKTIYAEDMKGNREITGSKELSLNGFARFSIPDIGDITVSTEDIDVEAYAKRLMSCRKTVADLCGKYERQKLSELRCLKKENDEKKQRLRDKKFERERILDGDCVEDLRLAVSAIETDASVEIPEALSNRIRDFLRSCDGDSLEAVIGADGSTLQAYRRKYCSDEGSNEKPDERLAEEIQRCTDDIDKIRADLCRYADIGEPQAFDERLRDLEQRLSDIGSRIRWVIRDKGAKEHELEDRDEAALMDMAEVKREEFNRQKRLYENYTVIKKDFTEIRDRISGHGVVDCLREKLSEYLAFITDGAVSLQMLDESLSPRVKSGGNVLARACHLSEGTRQTILLAYKLAVLEFFFREEGGVIVLDDCLLDMDAKRRERSVQLLKRFSERNQVIFSTCNTDIADMLGGHVIRF